jgi:two-component system cell cycle sensor histidine kinase/response regulator CckA
MRHDISFALQANEARYRAILDSALDAIVTIDGQGRVIEFNSAAERMFGYSAAEAAGQEMAELIVPPELRERHRQGLARQVATGVSTVMGRRIELTAQRRDGTVFPCELSIVRIGKDGDPPLFTGFIRDVTERKLADQKLRQDEAYLDIVGRAAHMGGWMVDVATRRVAWSDEACRIREFEPGTTVSLDEALALFAPEWREDARRTIDRCLGQGTPFDVEAESLTATGKRIWLRIIGRAVRDESGAVCRVHGALQDITERKRAEAEVCRASDRLVTTLETITDAFLTLDRTWRFTYLNERCEGILQRPRGELLGKNVWEEFPDAVGTVFEANYRRALAERCTVEFEEFYPPLGVWLQMSVYPSDEGLAVYFRDVTERKAAELARDALEARLRESQKMEAIGRLAGGVAHDFNNILGAILGNLDLARRASTSAVALESLEEIRKAGHRARDLVGQILSFSRRQALVRRRFDVGAVATESADLLRSTLPSRVRLETHLAAAAPAMILGDATQMGQVVLNLCTNAMQAIGDAGGQVDVSVDAVTLGEDRPNALRELATGPHVRLTVRDTGHGMDERTRAQIFEPFFTTKAVGEGTGLGLSVVHGIVQSHGGAIAVHSEPRGGATFELYFPAVDGASEQRDAPAAPGAGGQGTGQRILYLDDDEAQVFLARRLLEQRGYQVSAFQSQDEALEALRANPTGFDLLVTDYNMPGLSGLDVAREAREINPALPVAVASGYISEELSAQAEGAGVRELIFKPNVVTEFVAVVERLARRGTSAP